MENTVIADAEYHSFVVMIPTIIIGSFIATFVARPRTKRTLTLVRWMKF